MVKVDYTNEADAKEFWTGFSVAVADYDFEYADLLPYYNIKGQKKPQSLNKVFKHYNWNIVKEKAGLYYIQVPADNNPPEIKAPMAIQEAEIDTSSAVVLSWPAPAQSTTTMPSPKGKEPMPPIHTSSSSFGQAGPSAQGGSLAQVGSSGEVGSSGQSESSGDVGSSEQVG